MEAISVTGIVTKEINYGEADKIITLLTKEQGKLSVFCSGARRNRSRLASGTAFLSYGTFAVYRSSGLYKLTACEIEENFYHLRDNFEKLCFATYFAQFATEVTEESISNIAVMRLLLNTIYYLLHGKQECMVLKAVFELRCMCEIGYVPNIQSCIKCSESSEDMFFSPAHGTVLCCSCYQNESSYIPLSKAAYSCIKHIVFCEEKHLFSFQMSHRLSEEMNTLTERYIKEHIQKSFQALNYLKKMLYPEK